MKVKFSTLIIVGSAVISSLIVCFSSDPVLSPRTEYVCGDIDIRNHINSFSVLENCTVIEGHLHIRLVDHATAEQYSQLSFPKLREITEYILLYRVYGIRTLANIFPNLAVIRGQRLFYNYALVVFEMPDLEELGLASLTRIVRGAIRMEKNPQLCYIDTVNWAQLGVNTDESFILQNKNADECFKFSICPKDAGGADECERRQVVDVDTSEKFSQAVCWNAKSCQIVCPSECGHSGCYKDLRTSEKKCCNSKCLGGCRGSKESDCIACTNVSYNGECRSDCPVGTYKYRNRRCLTEGECRQLNFLSSDLGSENRPRQWWKLFDGQCLLECPSGYMENATDKHLCQQCPGRCPKVCGKLDVNSIDAAERASGCTIIDGSVEIQIRGGNQINAVLEKNLGGIEVIRDYLKVVRSHALLSLNFLKSLRLIRGVNKYDLKYALYVLDNQNLEETWDLEQHRELQIESGTMFFHINRKLCPKKIKNLGELVGIPESESDVSTANGDLAACEITTVDLSFIQISSTFALIRWTVFNTSDEREVLGWVIYYRDVKDENVTIFDSRDVCGSSDKWRTSDHRPDIDSSRQSTADVLVNLTPFTKYAVYVQTYTIVTAQSGARSPIVYFTTETEEPSTPRDVTVEAKYPGELHVSWKPPSHPNGNVTHYYVYWQPRPHNPKNYQNRDYCRDKLRVAPKVKVPEVVSITLNESSSGQCCQCQASSKERRIEDEERRFQIEFENFLQDAVFRKDHFYRHSTISSARRKRSFRQLFISRSRYKRAVLARYSSNSQMGKIRRVRRFSQDIDMDQVAEKASQYLNISKSDNTTGHGVPIGGGSSPVEADPYEAAVVYGKTELVLTNLVHFQDYSIEVIACHDYVPPKPNEKEGEKKCSNRAITTARTLPDHTADRIDQQNISFSIQRNTERGHGARVTFQWQDPSSPNAMVLLHDIELARVDVANHKPDVYCIPHSQFVATGGYVAERLDPGNWSFRIRVTSLAGNGPWTDYQYFYITHIDTPGAPLAIILIVVFISVVAVTLISVLAILYCLRKRREKQMNEENLYTLSANPNYADPEQRYVADEWEVPRDKVKKIRELGKGSFGMVYEGIAKCLGDDNTSVKVAIKTVNEQATVRDIVSFLNEASVMKQFRCHHVVKLLGIVSKGRPPWVIMELMANGDLKNYLRSLRAEDGETEQSLPLRQTLQMAGEIADGMAYLSYKKFVHRDLAARNCMVSEDLTVKIGDFGMTRDIYEREYYRNGTRGLLPVRWMAPEALKDGTFTVETDVWSYGIVLWEMATLAAMPYQGLSNEEVLKYVTSGGRMPRPENCPDRIYQLMDRCWQRDPRSRPSFHHILDSLVADLSEKFRQVSFYFNPDESTVAVDTEPSLHDIDVNCELSAADEIETAVDDENAKDDHCKSLLHCNDDTNSSRSETGAGSVSIGRLSPSKSRVSDRLAYGCVEGNSVPDKYYGNGIRLDCDRLLGGHDDTNVSKSVDTDSMKPIEYLPVVKQQKHDAPKSLTNGHIPYHSVKLNDVVSSRPSRTANC